MKDPHLNRFMKFVCLPDNPEGCWEWAGSKTHKGYGQFYWEGRPKHAHRISAHLLMDFDLKSDLHVCHSCDNPACVNPNHLWFGTNRENHRDKQEKDRQVYGSAVGTSKLNAFQVRVVKRLLELGSITQDEIGRFFGVSQAAVWKIASNKSWGRLD